MYSVIYPFQKTLNKKFTVLVKIPLEVSTEAGYELLDVRTTYHITHAQSHKHKATN